jgi:uncharacterized protein (DUF427 family)
MTDSTLGTDDEPTTAGRRGSRSGPPMDESAIAEWVRAHTGVEPWWPAVEPTARWIRVLLDDAVIADSRRARLLIQYGRPPMLPTYYFPLDDVDSDALVDATQLDDGSTRWSVAAGGTRVEDGAWTHPRAQGALADIEGMVTFTWQGRLQWLEEDERLFAHARDPHKRVDVAPSSRHVQVHVDGVQVADSSRPLLLFETSLPTRFYLPADDVRMDLLAPTETVSECPYKGRARYWSLRTNGVEHRDIAWSYPDPIPENPRIRDLVCFFNEKVDLVVDGEPWERPTSPWSTPPR